MRRLRSIRLVAMREILERGRSRGYLLSLVFTVFLLVAGFLLPAFLLGRDETPNLALVGTPPAGLEAAIQGVAGQYAPAMASSAASAMTKRLMGAVARFDATAVVVMPAPYGGPG